MYTGRERRLLKEMGRLELSVSHELDHLQRVAEMGKNLAKKYKGNRDVVVAAALVHDLGRSSLKARGKASAELGAKMAKPILKKVGYSKEESKSILQAVAEHDQPKFHSKLLEARILKDADYLDGFGARGILRAVLYAGETGGGVTEAVMRLQKKSRQRLAGLEFVESKRLGWKQQRLTEVFLEELKKKNLFSEVDYEGKFVVIEGISGSGKDTQANLLAKYLLKQGKKARVVNHPTKFLKKLWRQWISRVDDRASEAFLMMADRGRMVREEILGALKNGEIVISTRSSVSAQVYQKDERFGQAFYRLAFGFEPVADKIIYLEISASQALKRADKRVLKGKEKDRGFFGKRQKMQLNNFEEVLKYYPNVTKVDGKGMESEVYARVVDCIEDEL